jgi:hypothetical protein
VNPVIKRFLRVPAYSYVGLIPSFPQIKRSR